MTGTAQSSTASMAERASSPGSSGGSGSVSSVSNDFRSTPARNALSPAPVNTTTRTSGRSAKERKVSRSSAMVDRVMALTGGRSRVTVATKSSTSSLTSPTEQSLPCPPMPDALSWDEAVAEVCGPGGRYELVDGEVDGRLYKLFKNTPPSLRFLFELASGYGDLDHLVYEDERITFAESWQRVGAMGALLVDRYG